MSLWLRLGRCKLRLLLEALEDVLWLCCGGAGTCGGAGAKEIIAATGIGCVELIDLVGINSG